MTTTGTATTKNDNKRLSSVESQYCLHLYETCDHVHMTAVILFPYLSQFLSRLLVLPLRAFWRSVSDGNRT